MMILWMVLYTLLAPQITPVGYQPSGGIMGAPIYPGTHYAHVRHTGAVK